MRVAEFARYFAESPDLLGAEEIRKYQLHLIQIRKASWAVFNQTVCALRFLYRVSLQKEWAVEQIPFPRQEKKLPVVLSLGEVASLLGALENLKHRTLLMTIYSAGLRLSELLHLQVQDIDSQRMVLRVLQGKGRRDRYAVLSPALLKQLRLYWKQY